MKARSRTVPLTSLAQIKHDWVNCTRCEIGKRVRHHVLWDLSMMLGSEYADIAFIGEGPGLQEDIEGKTFVGVAGRLLRKTIAECKGRVCNHCMGTGKVDYPDNVKCSVCKGFGRYRLLLINLLVCRPYAKGPYQISNREPEVKEVMNCMPRLISTLLATNPSLIVALGNEAESYLSIIREELAKHGYVARYAKLSHPAAICRRGYTKEVTEHYKSDFKQLFDYYRTNCIARTYTPQVEHYPDTVFVPNGGAAFSLEED
jgi:uracil-DNA glycosylase